MGRKRLCVLRFLGPAGGTLRLIPKKDEAEAETPRANPRHVEVMRTMGYHGYGVRKGST